MNSAWYSALLPVCLLAGLTVAARTHQRSWMAPGAFFAAYWLMCVGLPFAFAPNFYTSPLAVWWVFASVLVLYLGSEVGRALGRVMHVRSPLPPRAMSRYLVPAVVATSVLGFGAIVAHLASVGLSVVVFGSIESLAETGRSFAVARYHDDYSGPVLARALLVPLYLSAPLGGWLAGVAREPFERRISLLPFLPATAFLAVMTTKSVLLTSAGLWVGGYLACSVFRRREMREVVTPRIMAFGFLAISILTAGFVLSFMARYGWSDFGELDRVWERMQLYAFGHLGGLSLWVDRGGLSPDQLSLGAYTFAGGFDALGISVREQGIYQDFVLIDEGVRTNIFTVFRGLVEDFSALGSLVVLSAAGVISGLVYEATRRGHVGALGPLCMFYGFTSWSFVVSLFSYNSYTAVAILLALFGVWLHLRYRMEAGSRVGLGSLPISHQR